jgi:hypothetical protein
MLLPMHYHLADSFRQTRFDDEFADFANFSVGKKTSAPTSELEDYLRLPVENVTDALKWWFDNRRTYPNLSRMARDYLSIPGKINIRRYSYN